MLQTNLAGATPYNIQESRRGPRYRGKSDQPLSKLPRSSTRKKFKTTERSIPKYQILNIAPNTKPRMTRRDRWLDPPRKCVAQYWAYKDALIRAKPRTNWACLSLQFCVPMPKSWSKKKKAMMNLQAHLPTPDLDNFVKAYKDCLLKQDSAVWRYGDIKKVWSYEGAIIIPNPVSEPDQNNLSQLSKQQMQGLPSDHYRSLQIVQPE